MDRASLDEKYRQKRYMVASLVRDGATISAVSKALGISRQRVSQIVHEQIGPDYLLQRRAQRHTEIAVRKHAERESRSMTRVCVICGKIFQTSNRRRRACDTRCSRAMNMNIHRIDPVRALKLRVAIARSTARHLNANYVYVAYAESILSAVCENRPLPPSNRSPWVVQRGEAWEALVSIVGEQRAIEMSLETSRKAQTLYGCWQQYVRCTPEDHVLLARLREYLREEGPYEYPQSS